MTIPTIYKQWEFRPSTYHKLVLPSKKPYMTKPKPKGQGGAPGSSNFKWHVLSFSWNSLNNLYQTFQWITFIKPFNVLMGENNLYQTFQWILNKEPNFSSWWMILGRRSSNFFLVWGFPSTQDQKKKHVLFLSILRCFDSTLEGRLKHQHWRFRNCTSDGLKKCSSVICTLEPPHGRQFGQVPSYNDTSWAVYYKKKTSYILCLYTLCMYIYIYVHIYIIYHLLFDTNIHFIYIYSYTSMYNLCIYIPYMSSLSPSPTDPRINRKMPVSRKCFGDTSIPEILPGSSRGSKWIR